MKFLKKTVIKMVIKEVSAKVVDWLIRFGWLYERERKSSEERLRNFAYAAVELEGMQMFPEKTFLIKPTLSNELKGARGNPLPISRRKRVNKSFLGRAKRNNRLRRMGMARPTRA